MFKHKKNKGIELESDGQIKLKPTRAERKAEKKRKREEKKELKREQKNINKTILDILPILDIDYDYIKTTTGYMNLYQIESKDVYSLNHDEIERHLHDFANFLKLYQDDMKIVCMQFPVNTEVQQENIEKKISETNKPMYIHFLKKRLMELQFLEANRFNREYFLFIYSEGNSLDKIIEKEDLIFRISNENIRFRKISEDKKLRILFKLCNQNSKI